MQEALEGLQERLLCALHDPKSSRDGGGYQLRIGYGSQRDEEHPILEFLQQIRSSLKSKAGLARPSWPGEGEQAHLLAA